MKKIQRIPKYYLSSRGFVTFTPLSSLSNGAKMYQLTNDLDSRKYPSPETGINPDYISDSCDDFKCLLKPNHYYIFVDKAILLNKGNVWAGHIASFLTDIKADVHPHSCVSLRRGKKVQNKSLVYTRPELNDHKKRSCQVFQIQFLDSIEDELSHYFFNRAIPDSSTGKRYLIELPISEIPISSDELILRTKHMKKKYSKKYFLLFDGKLNNDKFHKALNCISGFYGSHFLSGKIINPSPQMAAWSYLKLIFGIGMRDKLIAHTKLRDAEVERCQDDELKYSEWSDWPPKSTMDKT